MIIILQQLLILYAFLCLGYFFGKKKPALRDQTGILSYLLVNLFLAKKVYVLVAIRLVVVPLIVFALFKLLRLEAILPCALIMAAMPTGLNTIVFPKSVGKSSDLGARLAFLSHLFSCATIPLWLSILM